MGAGWFARGRLSGSFAGRFGRVLPPRVDVCGAGLVGLSGRGWSGSVDNRPNNRPIMVLSGFWRVLHIILWISCENRVLLWTVLSFRADPCGQPVETRWIDLYNLWISQKWQIEPEIPNFRSI